MSGGSPAHGIDYGLRWLLQWLSFGCVLLLLLILGFLVLEALPVLREVGWQLFSIEQGWHPLEGQFGLLPMLLASLAATVGAVLLALPLGILTALFLQYYASPRLALIYRLLLGLLAGIPSVVFGLWGLTRLVPLLAEWQPPGASLLVATAILALMILPTIALSSASALAALPHELECAAAALGMRRVIRVVSVLLPAARAGIVGVILAVVRALGETMAVLMVAGNVVNYPSGLFEPVRVLTANIALEMAYATDYHRASLFASGLLLTGLVLLLAAVAARMNRSAYA